MTLNTLELFCSFCNAPTKYVCENCYEPYCSFKCQLLDRLNHIVVCKPVPPLVEAKKIYNYIGPTDSLAPHSTSTVNEINTPEKVDELEINAQEEFPFDKTFNKVQTNELESEQASITIFTSNINKQIHDLQLIGLQTGENVPIIVTDTSMLRKNTIFAVDSAFNLNENLTKLAKYCQMNEDQIMNFTPKVNEICLAIFNEDGHWYRACCMKQFSQGNCLVRFVDFGAVGTVWPGNIMPIADELMFPIYTNRCLINNIRKEHFNKLSQYLKKERLLIADVKYCEKNKLYDIAIKNLDNILA